MSSVLPCTEKIKQPWIICDCWRCQQYELSMDLTEMEQQINLLLGQKSEEKTTTGSMISCDCRQCLQYKMFILDLDKMEEQINHQLCGLPTQTQNS